MAKRRRGKAGGSGPSTGVVVGLSLLAVLLVGAVGVGVWLLIRAWNADAPGGTVSVPDLAGMSRDEAQQALAAAELKPREGSAEHHDAVERGQVFAQDPAAGQQVRPGRTVRYFVSLGQATFTVPQLTGEALDNAPALLAKAGLKLGAVRRVYTRDRPPGRILNQTPLMGEEFTSSVPVDLVVADDSALPRIAMPDLTGLPLSGAEELLTRADVNLQLAVVEYVGEDATAPGTVIQQSPAAGADVALGEKVELRVAIPMELKVRPAKRLTLRIPIPAGPPRQLVKVKVFDQLGEKVDYSGEHAPGEVVERTVDVEGSAKVQVFVGGDKVPLREERL